MKKSIVFLMMNVLIFGTVAFAIPAADIYIPFENSDGTSGPGSESNPGWSNLGSSSPQNPYVIGPAATVDPTIVTPAVGNGIKGDYEDMLGTAVSMSGIHYNGATGDVLSGAKSMTATMWLRSNWRTGADNGHHYVFSWNNGAATMRYRTDAKVFMQYDNNWVGSGINGVGNVIAPSNGQWIFLAATVDSVNNQIIFYSGSKTSPVSMLGAVDTTAINALPVTATTAAFNLNQWGDETNAASTRPGLAMDEFRLYASSIDASGALSLADLESIRQFDLVPEPATISLLTLGMGCFLRKRRKVA